MGLTRHSRRTPEHNSHVDHPPYVRVAAPVVWTTLALRSMRTDVWTTRWSALADFARHWIYDRSGRHGAKSGLIEFRDWYREAFRSQTPWGGIDTPVPIRPAVSDVEREISDLVPPSNVWKPGRCSYGRASWQRVVPLVGRFCSRLSWWNGVAEVAPGAVLGERALLEHHVEHRQRRRISASVIVQRADQYSDRFGDSREESFTQDQVTSSDSAHRVANW
jgi:hypothetical protein